MIPSARVIMGATMRGLDARNEALFSYVNLEERLPGRHPLRTIREIVNGALARLDGVFATLCAWEGRPSIAPERLLRAPLIQILFSIRSERHLMEQMQYNLLFRWFVGLGIDDPVSVPTVFIKNRDRLLTIDIAGQFLAVILADGAVARLLWDEHFSVDGTLIQAWASMKSFQPKACPREGVWSLEIGELVYVRRSLHHGAPCMHLNLHAISRDQTPSRGRRWCWWRSDSS